jgi:hypothetical protein
MSEGKGSQLAERIKQMQQVGYGLGETVLQFCTYSNIKHQFPGGKAGIVMAGKFYFVPPCYFLTRNF